MHIVLRCGLCAVALLGLACGSDTPTPEPTLHPAAAEPAPAEEMPPVCDLSEPPVADAEGAPSPVATPPSPPSPARTPWARPAPAVDKARLTAELDAATALAPEARQAAKQRIFRELAARRRR